MLWNQFQTHQALIAQNLREFAFAEKFLGLRKVGLKSSGEA